MIDAVIMGAALAVLKREGRMTEDAAFEVRTPDGQVFKVFASGDVDGFPPGSAVVNRIPRIVADAVGGERRKQTHGNNAPMPT